MDNELDQYIRTYRDTYTRDAINNRLRTEGYSDAQIDAGWQQVLGEEIPANRQVGATVHATSKRAMGRSEFSCIIALMLGVGLLVLTVTDLGLGFAGNDS